MPQPAVTSASGASGHLPQPECAPRRNGHTLWRFSGGRGAYCDPVTLLLPGCAQSEPGDMQLEEAPPPLRVAMAMASPLRTATRSLHGAWALQRAPGPQPTLGERLTTQVWLGVEKCGPNADLSTDSCPTGGYTL